METIKRNQISDYPCYYFTMPINLQNIQCTYLLQNVQVTIFKSMILVIQIDHWILLAFVNLKSLSEFFCLGLVLGLVLHFASSNFDPISNYDSNLTIEDCDGLESNQLSENKCFCDDNLENDIEFGICKTTQGPYFNNVSTFLSIFDQLSPLVSILTTVST